MNRGPPRQDADDPVRITESDKKEEDSGGDDANQMDNLSNARRGRSSSISTIASSKSSASSVSSDAPAASGGRRGGVVGASNDNSGNDSGKGKGRPQRRQERKTTRRTSSVSSSDSISHMATNREGTIKITRNIRAHSVEQMSEPVEHPQSGVLYVYNVDGWMDKMSFYDKIAYSFGVPSTQKVVFCHYLDCKVMHYERTCQGVYHCPEREAFETAKNNGEDLHGLTEKDFAECTVKPCRFRFHTCKLHQQSLKRSGNCKFKLHFYVPQDKDNNQRLLLCLGTHAHALLPEDPLNPITKGVVRSTSDMDSAPRTRKPKVKAFRSSNAKSVEKSKEEQPLRTTELGAPEKIQKRVLPRRNAKRKSVIKEELSDEDDDMEDEDDPDFEVHDNITLATRKRSKGKEALRGKRRKPITSSDTLPTTPVSQRTFSPQQPKAYVNQYHGIPHHYPHHPNPGMLSIHPGSSTSSHSPMQTQDASPIQTQSQLQQLLFSLQLRQQQQQQQLQHLQQTQMPQQPTPFAQSMYQLQRNLQQSQTQVPLYNNNASGDRNMNVSSYAHHYNTNDINNRFHHQQHQGHIMQQQQKEKLKEEEEVENETSDTHQQHEMHQERYGRHRYTEGGYPNFGLDSLSANTGFHSLQAVGGQSGNAPLTQGQGHSNHSNHSLGMNIFGTGANSNHSNTHGFFNTPFALGANNGSHSNSIGFHSFGSGNHLPNMTCWPREPWSNHDQGDNSTSHAAPLTEMLNKDIEQSSSGLRSAMRGNDHHLLGRDYLNDLSNTGDKMEKSISISGFFNNNSNNNSNDGTICFASSDDVKKFVANSKESNQSDKRGNGNNEGKLAEDDNFQESVVENEMNPSNNSTSTSRGNKIFAEPREVKTQGVLNTAESMQDGNAMALLSSPSSDSIDGKSAMHLISENSEHSTSTSLPPIASMTSLSRWWNDSTNGSNSNSSPAGSRNNNHSTSNSSSRVNGNGET